MASPVWTWQDGARSDALKNQSTFVSMAILKLPAPFDNEKQSQNPNMSSTSDHDASSQLLQILLIEDSEDDGECTKLVLNEVYGADHYALTWLLSPTSAIEELRKRAFDVVLCDNYLGETTGIELITTIRSSMETCPPFILLTSVDDKVVDLGASTAGACDYLVKQDLTASVLERSIRYATTRKSFEEELLQVAHYDHLTGVANKKLFEFTLENSLIQANRAGTSLGLILLDLDKFKPVNDTFGHPAGDSLLRQVGERISGMIRQSDFIARIGGDEFCIIAANLGDPKHLAPMVSAVVAKLCEPYVIDGITVTIGASAGIAVYPNDCSNGDDLIKAADDALYRAKQKEGGSFNFSSPDIENSISAQQNAGKLTHSRQGSAVI